MFAQNVRLSFEISGGVRVHRIYGTVVEEPLEDAGELFLGDLPRRYMLEHHRRGKH